jgi:hypothetical protein
MAVVTRDKVESALIFMVLLPDNVRVGRRVAAVCVERIVIALRMRVVSALILNWSETDVRSSTLRLFPRAIPLSGRSGHRTRRQVTREGRESAPPGPIRCAMDGIVPDERPSA